MDSREVAQRSLYLSQRIGLAEEKGLLVEKKGLGTWAEKVLLMEDYGNLYPNTWTRKLAVFAGVPLPVNGSL